MRAAVLSAPGSMEIVDLPAPTAGTGEVLVRVEATGMCGSDRHIYVGTSPVALPLVPGHEICGIVVEAPGAAGDDLVGRRVTLDPNIPCRGCPACRRGDPHLCEHLSAIGVSRDGGFAEYVVAPREQAHVLPDDLPAALGTFVEPVGCCLRAIDRAGIRAGSSVVVFGGGVIGLIMLQLALLEGAGEVILVSGQESSRTLAEELGASGTVTPGADPEETAARIRGLVPHGVDVVIECAGTADAFTAATQTPRRGGAVILFGVMPSGQKVEVEPHDLLFRELRIEGSFLNPFSHARAAGLVGAGRLRLERLLTRTIDLDDLPSVLGALPRPGDIKTVVLNHS
jgi:threonine dehydrogenase-like Zn-dependent dehydrogenase